VKQDDVRILAAFRAAADYWGRGVWFISAVGGFIAIVAAVRGIWFLVAVGVGFFGLLAFGISRLRAKYTDPAGSPVLDALLNHPDRVTEITHFTASSSNGMFRKEFLRVKIQTGKHLALKVDDDELAALSAILIERCPNAKVKVPGFTRP